MRYASSPTRRERYMDRLAGSAEATVWRVRDAAYRAQAEAELAADQEEAIRQAAAGNGQALRDHMDRFNARVAELHERGAK